MKYRRRYGAAGDFLKSVSNEIKRKLRAETACINKTAVVAACAASVAAGTLFAVNGIDADVYKQMIKPSSALPAWLMIPFFATALCILAVSCVCAVSLTARISGRWQKIVPALYFAVLALYYVWIPLTYKAAAFFASFIVCVICLAVLCVIYSVICRAGKLPAVTVITFAVWVAYLAYLSIALFFVN